MKSKFNLIALSLLLATSTLSSASFASCTEIVEEKGPSYSRVIAKKLGTTVLESLVVGATVGAITHGVNGMEDSDAECLRAKLLLAGSALINTPGSLPTEWTSFESIKTLTKIGIKTAFTAGGMYMAASYYETVVKPLSGEIEPDENQRTFYTSYGAALGNLTGNVVVTSLDLTGSALSWGTKKLFGGFFGSNKSVSPVEVDIVSQEEARQRETLRLQQEEEQSRQTENLRLEQVAREQEEARSRELQDQLDLLGGKITETLETYEQTSADTQELQRLEAEERARELNKKQKFWNGVVIESEEEGMRRAESLKLTKKDKYLKTSEANKDASSSNSSD
jgi:hypothetical protein